MVRILRIRHGYPGVIMAALEARVREDLTTLPEESASWELHAEEYPLQHCGHLRRLSGVIVMVTGDLDEGRIGGFERQVRRSAAKDSRLDCPPDARPDVHWLPAEAPAVIAWRQSPRYQSGWPVFFALMSSFPEKQSHAPRRRRIPMPSGPRHNVRCNRHVARAGNVALISCCLVRLSNGGLGPPGDTVSLPACTQRSIRRGAALASRRDPLAFSGDKRGRSKALFYAMLNGTCISDPEPVRVSCDPESWAYGRSTSETTAKDIVSARISFLARAAILPLLDWLLSRVAHDCCNPEDPDALGDDSSFSSLTQQQWRVCVRRMLRCGLACMLPPSSLVPRLASGAFAVATDEGRDRLTGDRRPLNSRERTIGLAHVPCCP